jgi:hypothetical protein
MTNRLTLEEVLKLPAGPELDAQICEIVMGWKYAGFARRQPVYETSYSPIEFRQVEPGIDFCPSTKIQDAWLVIERLGCSMTVTLQMASTGGGNDCGVSIAGMAVWNNKNLPKDSVDLMNYSRRCTGQENIPFLLCQMAIEVEYENVENIK